MKQKIVVDSNILFSVILNPSSSIGKILLRSKGFFQLYSCSFLKFELSKHRDKLLKLTKLNNKELDELEFLITKNITFINERLLPQDMLMEAERIFLKVDLNDVPFVALSKFLHAKLWTGDKALIAGLNISGFNETLTTAQLSTLLEDMSNK